MRYFIHLAYNGKNYHGWQRQPNAVSVQEVIEKALSTILNEKISITGCGRTDTGVHASTYYAHFDTDQEIHPKLPGRMNKFMADDVVIYDIFKVIPDAHTRFDAKERAYEYWVSLDKNPFYPHGIWHYYAAKDAPLAALNEAAQLLLKYNHFFPFCKTGHDAKTYRCDIRKSEWHYNEQERKLVYHVHADRFLRGMIRLIVGMCFNVALGKIPMEAVEQALKEQQPLSKSWSVPPNGLYLSKVEYDFESIKVSS